VHSHAHTDIIQGAKQELLFQPEQMHSAWQQSGHINFEPSPSEAGDLASMAALGPDSGSAVNVAQGMVDKHVQAIRRRLAAMEKSFFFMQGRQNAAESLPSETAKYGQQYRDQYRQAKYSGMHDRAAAVKMEFTQWKTDLLYSRYSHAGCFGALYAALYYRL
jgi:hypothetical protein